MVHNDGAVRFTAARARSLRKENKENSAQESEREQKYNFASKVKPVTIRRALAAANTAVIGNTVDFPTLSEDDLNGTAISPAIILAGLNAEGQDVYYHLWVAVRSVIEESTGGRLSSRMVQSAMERFVVELGMAIYERNSGPQLTFVDPRKNDDAQAMARSAKRLMSLFRARGMSQEKIVISIPATEDGVAAAKELEAAGIRTNLIFIANIMHAAFCAQAGATAISIAVGPLLLCHERKRRAAYLELALHPGIEVIQATLEYFKLHNIHTRVVGRDFRQLAELSALSGFDAVCLSKEQLEVTRWKAETRSPDLSDRSPQASMRARQAQHPAKFLENGSGFMSVMSAEARRMLAATVYSALGKMELQMNAIEKIVREEVAWQLAQKTLSLEALYDLQLRSAPPSNPPKKRKERESGARAGSEKRRKPLADACERENKGGLIEGIEYF
ncbi:putative transaldolase [Mycena sanguinolenta]|uniref:Putative transaldolase n=1 Tax=Mycena sanguinolenta TaxID=230812 RepID=A0A8H7D931_9AGAR|nr:putative transaldolase [Mycena sanguinolenta]